MPGKLYVVGTPIGNLGDFSPRAVETLSSVDFIAAEDTRVTVKLLNRFEIKNKLISYHEHNRAEKGEAIIDMILSGKSCALVSDAGMPVISDPGQELVKLCRENVGIGVYAGEHPAELPGVRIIPDKLHVWEFSICVCTAAGHGVTAQEAEFIKCFRKW